MNSYKRSIIAAMSIFLILDTIAVAARIYVRTLLIRGFGWDDATLCLSFVSFLIQKLSDDVVVMVRQNADGDFAWTARLHRRLCYGLRFHILRLCR